MEISLQTIFSMRERKFSWNNVPTIIDLKFFLFLIIIATSSFFLGLYSTASCRFSSTLSDLPVVSAELPIPKDVKPPPIPEKPRPVEVKPENKSLEETILPPLKKTLKSVPKSLIPNLSRIDPSAIPDVLPFDSIKENGLHLYVDFGNPNPFHPFISSPKSGEIKQKGVTIKVTGFDTEVDRTEDAQHRKHTLAHSSFRSTSGDIIIFISGLVPKRLYTVKTWHHAFDKKDNSRFGILWAGKQTRAVRFNLTRFAGSRRLRRNKISSLETHVRSSETGEITARITKLGFEGELDLSLDLNALKVRQHCEVDEDCGEWLVCKRTWCLRDFYEMHKRIVALDSISGELTWLYTKEFAHARCCGQNTMSAPCEDRFTWEEAKEFCHNKNLHLCSPKTIDESYDKCQGVHWTSSELGSSNARVALISMWIGEEWPRYINLTTHSFGESEGTVDFFIFYTANNHPPLLPRRRNLHFFKMTHPDFFYRLKTLFTANNLPHLSVPANLLGGSSRKDGINWNSIFDVDLSMREVLPGAIVNDIKPTYASLFPDIIDNYDYWGWVDLDVLSGDLSTWLELDPELDVISFSEGYYKVVHVRGQMTIVKNRDKLNRLWQDKACTRRLTHSFHSLYGVGEYQSFKNDEGCFSTGVFEGKDIRVELQPLQTHEHHTMHVLYNGHHTFVCNYLWLAKCKKKLTQFQLGCPKKYRRGEMLWHGLTKQYAANGNNRQCMTWVWAEFRKCIAVQWDVLPKPDFIKDDVIDMNFGNDTEVYLQKIYFDPCIQLKDGKVREVMFMHWKKYKPQFTENFTFTGLKQNEWWAINTLGAQSITAN